jgi:hypothetical protein
MDLEIHLADGSGDSPAWLMDLETHLADGSGDSPG